MKKLLLIPAFILSISTTLLAQCSSWIEESVKGNNEFGANSVTTDADNNVYCIGTFQDSIIFSNDTLITSDLYGFYLNKFNSSGVVQWTIQFRPYSYLPPVVYQKNGALYVAGTYYDTLVTNVKNNTMLISPGYNFFLLKLDLNGNIIWSKTYKGSIDGEDEVGNIAVNNLNQVYFTGQFSDTVTFGSNVLITPQRSDWEAFINKTDSNGNVLWAIQPNSTAQFPNSAGWGITTDADDNLILAGDCDSIITFGSITFNAENTAPSSYLYSNPYVAKFDSLGNCQWIVGGQGYIELFNSLLGVITDAAENIYVVGTAFHNISFNGQILNADSVQLFYCKYSKSGNPIWIKEVNGKKGAYEENTTSLAIDDSNHLWMTGWSDSRLDFGNFNISGTGGFLAEFDTSGTFLNAIGSKGITYSNSLALDNEGNLYIGCNSLADTVSFDGITVINPVDNFFDIILKYCTSAAGIPQLSENKNQLSIYPNPTSNIINITSTKNIDEIRVTNLLGQVILKSPSEDLGVTKKEFDLSSFPSGMYFVTVSGVNTTETRKIIVNK